MSAFFVPRLAAGDLDAEGAYAAIRAHAEQDTGHVPHPRRIFQLSSRRGGKDCVTEVGQPDPINHDVVLAILDLGRGLPYLVHCGTPGEESSAVCELLSSRTYSVTEFSSS